MRDSKKLTFFMLIFVFLNFIFSIKLLAWLPEEKQDYKFVALIDTNYEKHLVVGKVISRKTKTVTEPYSFVKRVDTLRIKVLSKPLQNKIMTIQNYITGQRNIDVNVKEGDKCLLWLEMRNGKVANIYIADYYRLPNLILLLALLLGAFLAVTGFKGLRAFFALLLNVYLIFAVLFPMLLKGYNALALGALAVIIMTFITYFFIHGIRRETIPVIMGTLFGVLVAFVIAFVFKRILILTGLSDATARMLQFVKADLNFGHLLLLAIIIGALGAVMDIAMDISSALFELHDTNPDMSRKELARRGFNIGSSVLGTMINTLIFAYIGSSLLFILLYYASGFGNVNIINFQFIAQEYLQAVVGSIGLVVTVPSTIYSTILFLGGHMHTEK